MTFAFLVSIKKKNLKLAKLYKTFFVTSFIGTVLLEVILIHVEADNQVQIYETTVNVWTLTVIVIGVALVIFAAFLWIITQVIRYIESENETGEATEIFKPIQ
uniref:(northern house mosquito) hypothetical protein n=1 Tax=Culex pipiens TaxID=7175 RepID=A0A8D8ASV2_CULPI